MDDKMLVKEMLKDFIKTVPEEDRWFRCPFLRSSTPMESQLHELCAVVFPGWGRKYLERIDNKLYLKGDGCCPCRVMSNSYVRRKARAFVAKK